MSGKLTVENTTRLRLRYDNQLEKRIFLENQSESRVTVLTVTATVVTATVCTVTARRPIRMQRYRHRTYGYRAPTNQKKIEFFYSQSKVRIQLQYSYGHGTIRAVSHSYEIHSIDSVLDINTSNAPFPHYSVVSKSNA